jgi:hypothetical protein
MSTTELNQLVTEAIETLVDRSESAEQAEELLDEVINDTVPIYYAEQIKLLDDDDVFAIDVSEMVDVHEISVMKILPVAIFMALEEKVHERWAEVEHAFNPDL